MLIESKDQPNVPASDTRLSLGRKITYSLGEIANSIKTVTFALYSLFFATIVLGLPGSWIGIAAFGTIFWDAVIDPFIGYVTDRPGSRRHTFMLIGALTMGIGFWAFFSPPHALSKGVLLAWLIAASFVVRTATSMYSIPYYANGANLSDDYHERTSITAIRGIANIAGTSLTASLSFVLFFRERLPGVDPKLQHSGYGWMGLTFGLVMTAVALAGLYASRSMQRPVSAASVSSRPSPADFFRSMGESLRNKSFRIMLISFSLVVAALAVSGSMLLHFMTYYMKVNGSVAISSSQVAFYGGSLLGTVIFLRFAKSYDKHRMFVFSALLTSLLMLSASLLFGEGHPLGTGDVRPLLAGYGLTGFSSCILWFVPQSMLADVADEGEFLTGKRREGALFGMLSFGQQTAAGFAVLLAGSLLERFVKLVPGAAQQSVLSVRRIGFVYSVVPAALFLIAAVLMSRYRLSRSRVSMIQAELEIRNSGETKCQ